MAERRIDTVVAVYNPLVAERSGGTEKSTRNLLRFKTVPGIGEAEWTVITPYSPPGDLGVKGIELPASVPVPDSPYKIPPPEHLKRTVEQLEEQNPQLIILTNPNQYMNTLYDALPASLQNRSVALWRLQADFNPRQPMKAATEYDIVQNAKLVNIRRELGLKVPLNLAISRSVAETMENIGIPPEKIKIIPTQVGGEFSADLRFSEENIRDDYLKPKQLGILGVGRIVPRKGWDDVIEMWGHLRSTIGELALGSDFDEIKISIAGRGDENSPYVQHLREREKRIGKKTAHFPNSDKVTLEWIGDKTSEELKEYYNAYDVGAMFMDHTEAVGRVTIESLSSGMPVLGKKECESTFDIITGAPEDQPVGRIITSPAVAAQEVMKFMSNKLLLEQMQLAAAKYAAETFTLEEAEKAFWEALMPMLV